MLNLIIWEKTTEGRFYQNYNKNLKVEFYFYFRALTGNKTPAGLGYYDANGKWVRTA